MITADEIERLANTRPPIPGGYGRFCDLAWRSRDQIAAALRIAALVDRCWDKGWETCDGVTLPSPEVNGIVTAMDAYRNAMGKEAPDA